MPDSRTLSEKIWDAHVIASPLQETARLAALAEAGEEDTGLLAERADLLYIDLHLVHEVTSAQAFEGLRLSGRQVRRPDLTLATADHNVPTVHRDLPGPILFLFSKSPTSVRTPGSSASATSASTTAVRASSTSSARSRGSASLA